MKLILFVFLIISPLLSDYIENQKEYTLLNKYENSYLKLVEKAYKNKSFTKEKLQKALKDKEFHPLSDILRILAYDEINNFEYIAKHLDKSLSDKTVFEKDITLKLAFVDVLLRIGEYNEVIDMLNVKNIVLLLREDRNKAYYYLGTAKYLKSEKTILSKEFDIIKYKFKQSRKIYKEYKESTEGI